MSVLTAVLWVIWLYLAWLDEMSTDPNPWLLNLAREAARVLVTISTITLILGFLVCPVLRTALVWREIGNQEQRTRSARNTVTRLRIMHTDN
jgi:hypothetical protein